MINGFDEYQKLLSEYRFNEALSLIWKKLLELINILTKKNPGNCLKTPAGNLKRPINTILEHAVDEIEEIAELLEPFLPETSAKIKAQFTMPKLNRPLPFSRASLDKKTYFLFNRAIIKSVSPIRRTGNRKINGANSERKMSPELIEGKIRTSRTGEVFYERFCFYIRIGLRRTSRQNL